MPRTSRINSRRDNAGYNVVIACDYVPNVQGQLEAKCRYSPGSPSTFRGQMAEPTRLSWSSENHWKTARSNAAHSQEFLSSTRPGRRTERELAALGKVGRCNSAAHRARSSRRHFTQIGKPEHNLRPHPPAPTSRCIAMYGA